MTHEISNQVLNDSLVWGLIYWSIICTFSRSYLYELFCITLGVLWGATTMIRLEASRSSRMCFEPAIVAVNKEFRQGRTLAMGIVASGGGLGSFILPVIVKKIRFISHSRPMDGAGRSGSWDLRCLESVHDRRSQYHPYSCESRSPPERKAIRNHFGICYRLANSLQKLISCFCKATRVHSSDKRLSLGCFDLVSVLLLWIW